MSSESISNNLAEFQVLGFQITSLHNFWSNYDKYMPAEIKRQAIINDNSHLTMLEKCKVRLSTYENVVNTAISDTKRRSSIFQDFGKRKQWN